MSSKSLNVDIVDEVSNAHDGSNAEVQGEEHRDEIIYQDLKKALESDWTQQTPSKRIDRLPKSATTGDQREYYYPKVVSIGPIHYGKEDLMEVQKLKLDFAKYLFHKRNKKLIALYNKLQNQPTVLEDLRDEYDDKYRSKFSDTVFANMMLLDGCFILYYILLTEYHIVTGVTFTNRQMICIRQDLFLLENQIPFKVLQMVMDEHDHSLCKAAIQGFIAESTFSGPTATIPDVDLSNCVHLLQLLRLSVTKCKGGRSISRSPGYLSQDIQLQQHASSLPTVKELVDAGIRFKTKNTTSLCRIGFSKHWWWCMSTATIKLPPIILDSSTRSLFLNLMAYESFSHNNEDMWVTSYIHLLNTLISRSEDVKYLRDAGVFVECEGNDRDIKYFIKEIAASAGSVRDNSAYSEAKNQIQQFYDQVKVRNKPITEFKAKYFSSPWSLLALVGAILALFLSAVQTYFTIWSLKGECDHVCKFLKLNHHL